MIFWQTLVQGVNERGHVLVQICRRSFQQADLAADLGVVLRV